MNTLLRLAAFSAWNRRFTLGLMLLAVALSTVLLLGIDRIRDQVRDGFTQSVAGTDLVVGARSSPIQLMLYAIFRTGGATNNISWQSAQKLADNPAVAWTIPLSLGDSHRGFPVLATNKDYFRHFQYGNRQSLRLVEGLPFQDVFETVLGSEVAQRLHYKVGDRIVLSHGSGDQHLSDHADKPFIVTGILAQTGTPVDRTVHIGLEGMEAIHLDWEGGAPLPGMVIPAGMVKKFDLQPKNITAVLLGLKHRTGIFALQRDIAEDRSEPLMAVLPGVALDELWQMVGVGEKMLFTVSAMVMAVGLAGLASAILASLGERRRELAVLRSVGARPADIFCLLAIEGLFVMLAGVLLGVALLTTASFFLEPILEARFGVTFRAVMPTISEGQTLLWIVIAGLAVSLVPGFKAYRLSLSDGLTPRI